MDKTDYIDNDQQLDMIPAKDVSTIKIKLGKSHRKEADWEVIKDILRDSNIIVMETREKTRKIRNVDHILYDSGYLVTFTNLDDCKKYISELNVREGRVGRMFLIGVMPFLQATEIADAHKMDILIDPQFEKNSMCIRYDSEKHMLAATMLA